MRLPKEIEETKTALESKGFSTEVEVKDDGGCSSEKVRIVMHVFVANKASKKFATLWLTIVEEMKNYAVSRKKVVRELSICDPPNTMDAGRKIFEGRLKNFVQSLPETFWPKTI